MDSMFHITETLALTTELRGAIRGLNRASMDSTFHITETLPFTTVAETGLFVVLNINYLCCDDR